VHKDELPASRLEKLGMHSREALIEQREDEQGRSVTEFVYPLFAEQKCLQCHEVIVGEGLGAMSLLLDDSKIQQGAERDRTALMMISLVEVVALLLLLLWVLNILIFRPLGRLSDGANRMAGGDLNSDIDGGSNTEMGVLVRAFNHMAEKIRSLLGDQDNVIKEQTLELTHLIEASQYIGSEQPLPDILEQFSKALVDVLRVTTCRMVMLGDQGTLHTEVEHPIRSLPDAESPDGNRRNCPLLWTVINLNRYLMIRHDDLLTETERQIMRLDQADAALCVPISNKGEVFGIVVLSEFRTADRDPIDERKIHVCRAMVSQMGAAIEIARLYDRLVEQMLETVLAMAESVEKKSPWTAGHSRRVTRYALGIAKEMGWNEEQQEQMRIAGLLHDIGKIAVPGTILNKNGKLDEEEYTIMKRHPDDGAQILSKISMLRPHIPIIRHHHEWINGSGYPDGLSGDEIPLGARILSVADAYDAMTADRPYRKGLSVRKAMDRLDEAAGIQFDGNAVKALKRSLKLSGSDGGDVAG